MKSSRKGLGKGRGTGYKNMIRSDPVVHQRAGKGQKTYSSVTEKKMMQPRFAQVRVFKFDEAPEELKKKILDNYRDFNMEGDWYEQDGLLDFNEKDYQKAGVKPLSKNWFNKPLKSDGIHSEGEEYPAHTGLIKYKIGEFDLDRYNYLQFENIKVTDDEVFRKFLQIPAETWKKTGYKFENDRERDTKIDFYMDDAEPTKADESAWEKAKEIFSDKVHEARKMLKEQMEYNYSDEAIAEGLRANEYDFNEDGKIQ